jgi:thioesterase III
MEKIVSSKTKIRFQDCDPFNHLNNSKYVDYFINAREDQLIAHYDIDIYKIAFQEKIGWVVASNQISYLKPAFMNENIIIESQLIQYSAKSLHVELRMYNEQRTELKSVMWSKFVHIDIATQRSIDHAEKFTQLFDSIVLPVAETYFEERVLGIIKNKEILQKIPTA